jgi:hypothetical protein
MAERSKSGRAGAVHGKGTDQEERPDTLDAGHRIRISGFGDWPNGDSWRYSASVVLLRGMALEQARRAADKLVLARINGDASANSQSGTSGLQLENFDYVEFCVCDQQGVSPGFYEDSDDLHTELSLDDDAGLPRLDPKRAH